MLVNDLGPAASDKNKKAADVVVEEITKAGGEAMANYDSNTAVSYTHLTLPTNREV